MTATINELQATLHDQDEWPTRIVKLIVDLVERHTAKTGAVDLPAEEMATHLLAVAEEQIGTHLRCEAGPINMNVAGIATHHVEFAIDLDYLSEALTEAAAELQANQFLV